MRLKISGLFIILLMFAAAVNGFCGGTKELETKVNNLQRDTNNSLQEINTRLDNIERERQLISDINVNINEVVGGNTEEHPQVNATGTSGALSDNSVLLDQAQSNNAAIRIEDSGSMSKSAIVNYIRNKNPAVSVMEVENLIDTYFREAEKEGINQDLAVAQMLYITKYMDNKELINVNNYAGLDPVSGQAVRFDNMQDGVRAHIQHLKGYSSNINSSQLKETLTDPRWDMLNDFRGTIKTLDGLSTKWAPNNSEYQKNIENIIYEMRRFS